MADRPMGDQSPSRVGNSTHTMELLSCISGAASPESDSAWSLFDQRYRPLVVAVIRRLGLSADDADDAAQQTMLEFVRDIRSGHYDPTRGRLRGWLVVTARHRAIDLLRSRNLRPANLAIENMADEGTLIEAWESARRVGVLGEAMRRLRDETGIEARTFEAFDRFAVRDEPASAVAEALGFETAEVYRIKHRLTGRLRELVALIDLAWTSDGAPSHPTEPDNRA